MIRKRLREETPAFFKVLRNIAIGAVTISGVILALPLAIPAGLIAVATYVTVIGSAIGITSQLTVKDPNKL